MAKVDVVTLDAQKTFLRDQAKRRRAQVAGDEAKVRAAAGALGTRVLDSIDMPDGCAVSAYWPIGSELDPRALMRLLHERGHPVCLPVVTGTGRPLVFRAWAPGDTLEPAGFGTQVPTTGQPERTPRVLLVPMLAFDRDGYRLGYGGGFYDRTLAKLRAEGEVTAVGLAFAAQEVPAVPRDVSDQHLDWIVTESEAIAIE